MESSECESADDTNAEQLVTVHCTKQSGGGSASAMAKADRLAAECLWKKRHRAKETAKETAEEHAARQQSYMPFCARCSHQTCTTVAPACVRCGHNYICIYICKISNRTQSLASLRSPMLAARQLYVCNLRMRCCQCTAVEVFSRVSFLQIPHLIIIV